MFDAPNDKVSKREMISKSATCFEFLIPFYILELKGMTNHVFCVNLRLQQQLNLLSCYFLPGHTVVCNRLTAHFFKIVTLRICIIYFYYTCTFCLKFTFKLAYQYFCLLDGFASFNSIKIFVSKEETTRIAMSFAEIIAMIFA